MTMYENLQQRAGLHARVGAHVARQNAPPHGAGDGNAVDPVKSTSTTPTSTGRATSTKKDPDDDDNKTTSTTTKTTSTTSNSSASSSSSSSSTTSSTSTTSTTPSLTTTITPKAAITTTHIVTTSKAVSSAASSATSTAVASNSSSTGAIVGGVGGGILGAIVIAIFAAFVVRRMRRKRDDRALNFDPDNFRRSAVLLPDDYGSAKPTLPGMAEKHAGGAASYQYSDVPQEPSTIYGASEGQYNSYGASQYSAAPGTIYNAHAASAGYDGQYEQPGFGAPPVPGQHGPGSYGGYGAYGAAGAAAGYQSRQQYQQEYPSASPYQQVQHHIAGAGPYGPNGTRSPPTTSPPTSEHHGTSPSPNPISRSLSNAAGSQPHTQPEYARGPTAALSRQPTQSNGIPPAYDDNAGKYTELKRDEKVKPAEMSVQNGLAASSAPRETKLRPTSAYTVYDPEDAYGGM
ncbi:hypothetical protein CPB83DRAFT_892624 [Crepidotus variabilis]|uniref:Uncharacterized protein n=1 Tax=Crepidotus variabilis TaxID=179855 RepID=A0A9P6EIK1_9AGAR|nr:hypothetical protein CPB83DRAFT_892624 [Crepidotus variabilis]